MLIPTSKGRGETGEASAGVGVACYIVPYSLKAVDMLKSTWCSDDSVATVDFMLPTGIMVPMLVEVNRHLIDIKADLWKEANKYPLFNCLRPMNQYCFTCVTHMAEKVELLEENKSLTEVRPFIPMLKVIEKKGQVAQKIVDAQISSLIGRNLTELDNLLETEVVDFRSKMRIKCQRIQKEKFKQSTVDKLAYLSPSHVSDTATLSAAVRNKLQSDNTCQIVISSCTPKVLSRQIDQTIRISLDKLPFFLIQQTLTKLDLRSAIPNGNDPNSYLLKVWMRNEFLLGEKPLSQYHYIRRCILKNTKPKLLLISKNDIDVGAGEEIDYYSPTRKPLPPPVPERPLLSSIPLGGPSSAPPSPAPRRHRPLARSIDPSCNIHPPQPPRLPPKRRRAFSVSAGIPDSTPMKPEIRVNFNNNNNFYNNYGVMSLKEDKEVRNPLSKNLYDCPDMFNFTIHTASSIAIRACLYHGSETISNTVNSKVCILDTQQNEAHWGSETIDMNIELRNLPRMARLCFMLFSMSSTSKKTKKEIQPLAWVNLSLFDYTGRLRTERHVLHMWSYDNEECYSQETGLNPIGTISSNPAKHSAVRFDFSLDNYSNKHGICYPTLKEILELAADITTLNNSSNVLIDVHDEQKVKKTIFDTIKQKELNLNEHSMYQLELILDKDPLSPLHEQEKEIIWLLRFECNKFRKSLTRLVISTNWANRNDVAQLQAIVQSWPAVDPLDALELLDFAYADVYVRRFAVDCLRTMSDVKLNEYLLQLVQALKYENYLKCDLVDFLLERALNNRRIGHFLFWLLKSEMHVPSVSIRFGLILEAYCRHNLPHLRSLTQQQEALHKLKKINDLVKNHTFRVREKAVEQMQALMSKEIFSTPLNNLTSILDPALTLGNIRQENCTFMDSAKRPLWLCWTTDDPHMDKHKTLIMYKSGDDLRQDMLTLQILRIMDGIWQDDGLDFRLSIYGCITTGDCEGLIEVVPRAETVSNIQKKYNTAMTSAFQKKSIFNWLKEHNKTESSLNQAIEEFTMSCAGYCVATYVLGIKDRHCGNIMIKRNGQMFHIDFGHFLGHSKYKFGVKRERVPFVLTNDYVYVIQGGDPAIEGNCNRFMNLCEQAYLALRAKSSFLLSLFMMMLNTGIPELSSIQDIEYIRQALLVDQSEELAKLHFKGKFREAIKQSWKTMVNNAFHNMATN